MSKFQIVLKKLREEAGYSQYSFADAFGVSQSTVGNWESGAREPKFNTMQKLADFFGVTVDYLLGRTDDPDDVRQHVDDDEALEYLDELHKRPEMKILFDVSRKATKKDIETAVTIIEALKKQNRYEDD